MPLQRHQETKGIFHVHSYNSIHETEIRSVCMLSLMPRITCPSNDSDAGMLLCVSSYPPKIATTSFRLANSCKQERMSI